MDLPLWPLPHRRKPAQTSRDAGLLHAVVGLALCALVGGGLAVYGPVALRPPTPEAPTFERRLAAEDGTAQRTRFGWGAALGFGLAAVVLAVSAGGGEAKDLPERRAVD